MTRSAPASRLPFAAYRKAAQDRRKLLAMALASCAVHMPLLAQRGPSPARPRVLLFTPNSEGNSYWPQVFRIMGKVASDLGFDLAPYSFGVQDRFTRQQDNLRLLAQEPRPQAVIASVVIGQSKGILDAAEALGIPVFLLGPLFPAELPQMGEAPRRKYKRWVALFNWAEEEKGYALGKELLLHARRQGAFGRDGSLQVVGLGGDPSWFGSGLRQTGLMRALREDPQARLMQVAPTQWTQREGRELTTRLLRRFPEATVVWAASDQLGAGAVQALTEAGRIMGKTAFTGGLDLSDLGLRLVKEGSFVATAASTLLSYAEVAVLVYDYLQGLDFNSELDGTIHFPTLVATRETVDQHLRMSSCLDHIDFRSFSKAWNHGLARYDFSWDAYRDAARTCLNRGMRTPA